MFWKRFASPGGGHGDTTLIATGAVIDGTITFAGVLEIEGRVNGNIASAGDDKAVVRVLQGGYVHGNVSAPLVAVDGTVTGNVHSANHVQIAPHAVINGDVRYNLLEMSKGAQINGRLVFDGGTPAHTEVLEAASARLREDPEFSE